MHSEFVKNMSDRKNPLGTERILRLLKGIFLSTDAPMMRKNTHEKSYQNTTKYLAIIEK